MQLKHYRGGKRSKKCICSTFDLQGCECSNHTCASCGFQHYTTRNLVELYGPFLNRYRYSVEKTRLVNWLHRTDKVTICWQTVLLDPIQVTDQIKELLGHVHAAGFKGSFWLARFCLLGYLYNCSINIPTRFW
jgi:hypothetical protein